MLISENVRKLEAANQTLKEEIIRLYQLYGDDCKPKKCQECKLFHQHYIRCDQMFVKINEGHCTAGNRNKKRTAEDERCQFFQSKI